MDIATLGGFAGGMILLILSIVLSGNSLTLFVDAASFLIVIVGSLAALMAANPLARTLGMIKFIKIAFRVRVFKKDELITQLVSFSESARKEGLLSLDNILNDVEDKFMKDEVSCRWNRS